MSYAPEYIADSSGKWCGNGLRFATHAEAHANAVNKMFTWMLVREIRVVESPDPVNYRWTNGQLLEVIDDATLARYGMAVVDASKVST